MQKKILYIVKAFLFLSIALLFVIPVLWSFMSLLWSDYYAEFTNGTLFPVNNVTSLFNSDVVSQKIYNVFAQNLFKFYSLIVLIFSIGFSICLYSFLYFKEILNFKKYKKQFLLIIGILFAIVTLLFIYKWPYLSNIIKINYNIILLLLFNYLLSKISKHTSLNKSQYKQINLNDISIMEIYIHSLFRKWKALLFTIILNYFILINII